MEGRGRDRGCPQARGRRPPSQTPTPARFGGDPGVALPLLNTWKKTKDDEYFVTRKSSVTVTFPGFVPSSLRWRPCTQGADTWPRNLSYRKSADLDRDTSTESPGSVPPPSGFAQPPQRLPLVTVPLGRPQLLT